MTGEELTNEAKKATPKELRGIYEQLTGKWTVNRNIQGLRARVLKLIATSVAAEKPAKAKAEKPAKAKAEKPAKAKAEKPAKGDRGHTKSVFAALPKGIDLVHAFRDREDARVRVIEPVNADGSGGRFSYKAPGEHRAREYEGIKGLREIAQLASGGAGWNVLFFYRRSDTGKLLMEYPKHKNRAKSSIV